MSADRAARREYVAVLLAGAAGAGLVLLAIRESWARVATRAPAPLPSSVVTVSGESLVPLASALALAALAGLAAVIATRGAARRIVGALLVLFGAGIVAAVTARLGTAAILAAAHSAAASAAGSATTGGSAAAPGTFPGGMPGVTAAARVTLVGIGWRAVVVAGSLAVAAAGAATAWRGARWPGLSSRYEQPSGQRPQPVAGADAATMWESLTQGIDPTEIPAASARGASARGAAAAATGRRPASPEPPE